MSNRTTIDVAAAHRAAIDAANRRQGRAAFIVTPSHPLPVTAIAVEIMRNGLAAVGALWLLGRLLGVA